MALQSLIAIYNELLNLKFKTYSIEVEDFDYRCPVKK